MLLIHLKFAIRVFLRDKFFSILNILGLGLGIGTGILLLLILQNDLMYDQHHLNHKRIYRLGCHYEITGVDSWIASTARELGPILKDEFPEVQQVVTVESLDRKRIKTETSEENKTFFEENIIQIDSNYFQVFTHEFIAGDAKDCLNNLHQVVITESAAKKYFGGETALNKSLIIDNELWKVTGVIKDLPENNHLKFEIALSGLAPYRDWTIDKGQPTSEAFWNPDVYVYLLFPENYNPADFNLKFSSIYNKYFKPLGDKVNGKITPILEPLTDIHFHSNLSDNEPHGNIIYLYAFSVIGILIVLLACINYMNLSTAKSIKRVSEVAVKKIVGSSKTLLIQSFLVESILLALISLLLGIIFVWIVLNATPFNQLIDKTLTLNFSNPTLLLGSIGISIGIGIISGLYPALYLPSLPILSAIKGSFKYKKSNQRLRQILLTIQFSISIFIVTCTLLMRDQIEYVRSKDLGFNPENVMILPIQDTVVQQQLRLIQNDLLQNPNILVATTSYEIMGSDIGSNVMWGESDTGMKEHGGFLIMTVGDDFLKTMGLTLISGRDFHAGSKMDIDGAYIANEAAVKAMGWGKDAIGKKVTFWHGENSGQNIGVVKNFNFSSLHHKVQPMFIIKAQNPGGFLHLKLSGENMGEIVQGVKNKWVRYFPDHPFEYFFLDQRFNEQYKSDETQNKLLSGLSWICITISLLGLLGLSAFAAAQRTKEIGVRKILGANVSTIILLLSKDILLLIFLAAVLAAPFSYWIISYWKKNFVYKTQPDYLLFILITLSALGLVFITVMLQSLKTASSNPVKSLKYE